MRNVKKKRKGGVEEGDKTTCVCLLGWLSGLLRVKEREARESKDEERGRRNHQYPSLFLPALNLDTTQWQLASRILWEGRSAGGGG